jgi:hypothetical protein
MEIRIKTSKNVPEHKDKLGRDIGLQDFVAYPQQNMLQFGRVTKINNKMIRVVPLLTKRHHEGNLKYPTDMVRLDEKDMTWYILKHSE